MRPPILIFAFALVVFGGPRSPVVLTSGTAVFPTRSIEVKGCGGVFDSGRKSSPADCFPSPMTIEIVKASGTASDLRAAAVVQVKVTNTSTARIRLPNSPEPVLGSGQHSLFSFALYCRPGGVNTLTTWLAFADSGTSSSMIDLDASNSIVYELRLDKPAIEQFAKAEKEVTELQIALYAFTFSGDTSVRQSGPLLTPPIEIPR